jgi:Flp pilus assembly protein TadD
VESHDDPLHVTAVTSPPLRTSVLAILLLVYISIFMRDPLSAFRTRVSFDPLSPRAHVVEQLMAARQYARALPLAVELRRTFPGEPEVVYWIAVIHSGLNDWPSAASAWEEYMRLSSTPGEACPALADAYTRMGDAGEALAAYERCVRFDPTDSDRLFDLAGAYERAGRIVDAVPAYKQAATLDPYNPAIVARIEVLQRQPQPEAVTVSSPDILQHAMIPEMSTPGGTGGKR